MLVLPSLDCSRAWEGMRASYGGIREKKVAKNRYKDTEEVRSDRRTGSTSSEGNKGVLRERDKVHASTTSISFALVNYP